MDSSYVSRMDNLTTPASAIIAAVLNETLPPDLTLFDLVCHRRANKWTSYFPAQK